jgi:hypothetical protein
MVNGRRLPSVTTTDGMVDGRGAIQGLSFVIVSRVLV